jgi:putative transcriptional regulator
LKKLFKWTSARYRPTQGKLLLSEPFLPDSFFRRSVVLLSEHTQKGSVGFILNKPTEIKITDAIEDFPDFDAPLFFGGPVETETLHFIHRLGTTLQGGLQIHNEIYWGGDFDQLKLLVDTGQVSTNDIRFFIGYSGWGPKQLQNEFKEKSWIVSDGANRFTFYPDTKNHWKSVLKSMGQDYELIAGFPEDPSWN